MNKQKKKKFNNLLLPIILVLAVIPYIVRLFTYQAGFSSFSWYSDFDIVNDLFSYYRSYIFILIAIAAAIILIPYSFLQREVMKDMKPMIPIGIYALFTILSTLVSVNLGSSLLGGYAHFESVFVIFGYLIMLLYTYQIDKKEEDYRAILKALLISLVAMSVIGIFQVAGKDLLYDRWVQKLIIPRSEWKDYLGKIKSRLSTNAISLTLFNPNYASVYLAMILSFLTAFLLPDSDKKGQKKTNMLSNRERILIAIILVLLTLLLFYTLSRTGLIAVVIPLMILGLLQRRFLLGCWKQCCLIVLCAIILFIGIDYINQFQYINKLTGTVQSFYDKESTDSLEKILTSDQGVTIKINGEEILVAFATDSMDNKLIFQDASGKNISSHYNATTRILNWNHFKQIKFNIKIINKINYIYCKINNITWRFYRDQSKGYLYYNDLGKSDQLKRIDHIGAKSMEDIGSGRGYIWSRSLPLLKNTILVGTGPDTFPYVFPQSDYVGKANNCKTPYTLVEKPHNLYLMMGIQSGMISMITFLVFYLIYFIKSYRIYNNSILTTIKGRMGLGCFLATLSFMISGFFNDSSIQTTPVFIILLGLGMDINYQLVKEKMAER